MQLRIQVNAPAKPDEISAVDTGLKNYNNSSSTIDNVKPLHVIATGDDGKVNGGAIGRTWGECCELQLFWVDAEFRGRGTGTLIMDSFEQEALERDCKLIYLDTFTFQAPIFYKERGYTEVSRITGFTGGEEKIYMQKRIGL